MASVGTERANSPNCANPTLDSGSMYQPLDLARREIRLLQIVGGSNDGPIECHFHTVSLDDDDIEFAALSYVWGDASVTEDILLNGHQRAVTTNLESALRHFWSYFKKNWAHAYKRLNLLRFLDQEGLDVRLLKRHFIVEDGALHHEIDSDDESSTTSESSTYSEGVNDTQMGEDTINEDEADNEMTSESEDYHRRNSGNGGEGEDDEKLRLSQEEHETDEMGDVEDASLRLKVVSAYHRARVGGGGLLIWVDALCINQDDSREKSHQIQLINDIYTKATKVFSWLGWPDNRNLDLALKTIRRIAPSLRKGVNEFELMRKHPELRGSHDTRHHCLNMSCRHHCLNKYWRAILEFEKSEYFRRLWIFQEIWAATYTVIFICGDEHLPNLTLLIYLRWATSLSGRFRHIVAKFETLDMVLALKNQPMDSSKRIYAWFSILRQCRCKDSRDKVFALLGVFQTSITPDYSMTTAEVYANWATDPRLNIPLRLLLTYSGIGLYSRGVEHHVLPSWLPNLDILCEQTESWDMTYKFRYLKTEIPSRFRASASQISGITCYGVQLTEVCDLATRAAKAPTGYGIDGSPRDKFQGIQGDGREQLFPVLKYLIADRWRLWGESYLTGGSRLWALVRTVVKCVSRQVLRSDADITPDSMNAFSLENLLRYSKHYLREGKGGPDAFRQHELEIMGFPSEEEMWDSLSLRTDSPGLGPKEEEGLKRLVRCFAPVAVEKCLFHTTNGLIGVGPPGMETGDLVYLIHGSCLPVLVREVDGSLLNVGVCYVHGASGAKGSQILMDSERDVREVNIV